MIPAIHRSLGLDEKGVGLLTGLPVLLLAAVAIPGALLIARLGTRRALLTGLLAVAVAGGLRGVGISLGVLFAATLVMGAGVAVSQPGYPALAREWFPARVGMATAVYSNGLLVGELVPASLTGPLVLPALGSSWPLSFAFWSLPVLLTLAVMLVLTAHPAPDPSAAPGRWWPDFRSRQTWQIGLVMGCASAAYFGINSFLPDFVRAAHHPDLKDPALAALNTCQLPASLLVLALPERLVARRAPLIGIGLVLAASTLGIILMPGAWVVFWAGLAGFAAGLSLVLVLALPAILAAPGEVARFSAGIFVNISTFSVAGPLAGGAAWDLSGRPAAAFAVLGLGGLLMAGLSATLPLGPVSGAAARPPAGAGP